MNKIFLVVSLMLSLTASIAQQNNSFILLAKSKSDGVWLRWAPTNITTWQLANKYGYGLERISLLPNGDIEPNSQKILSTGIKPYSLQEFEKLSNPADEVLAVQELLYGDAFKAAYSSNDIASVITKSHELENRFGITLLMCDVSQEAARSAGLFYKDATVQKGKRYVYRLKLVSSNSKLEIKPVTTMVTVTDEKPMLVIKDLKATFSDHKVTLSWPTLLHRGIYSAYNVEKSLDGKTYQKMSELPYVHMSHTLNNETAHFVDSLDSNGRTLYYRLTGISPFAETGPYSNVVSGEGIENLAGYLVIREGKVFEKTKVKLTWEFPVEAEKQIAGFVVSASNNPTNLFNDLTKKPLLKTSREFTTETPFHNTYYILKAVNEKGIEITQSYQYLVQVADETPPANPSNLQGTMSAIGIATLTWNANTDSDLLGYRVFRSNSLHDEFVEVTKEIIPKPYFIDSVNIKVLNKKIYYYAVAMDKNYNPSDYSNLLTLTRPDIIPPVPPVLTKTEMKLDSISLEWINSTSDDIAKYELTRIEKEEKLTRVLASWTSASPLTSFNDKSLNLGKTYSYKITAFDSVGNKSETTSRMIYFETGVRKSVTGFKITADREKKEIYIQWKNNVPAVKCLIYRKINDGSFTIYHTIEGNAETFIDKRISISNVYAYKVQPYFADGTKALLSDGVNVKF